jgi:pimeloyl-ACP methyl ester carboxylesterase
MSKPKIHFAHANGFPAKTYSKLFSFLADDYEINYIERHAHNPKFPVANGWARLRDELTEEIERRYAGEKIIGLGHSLGGILHLLAAAEKPELYSAIVLLDAPIISPLSSFGIKILRRIGLMKKLPLVKTTRFRRASWKNKREALEHFKTKEKFKLFDADALSDYVEHGTVQNAANVNLFFKPSVEAKIYETLPDYLPRLKNKLKVPAAYIGGTDSHEAKLARLGFMRRNFRVDFRFVEGSHLFPLERPRETAEIIKQSLQPLAANRSF